MKQRNIFRSAVGSAVMILGAIVIVEHSSTCAIGAAVMTTEQMRSSWVYNQIGATKSAGSTARRHVQHRATTICLPDLHSRILG